MDTPNSFVSRRGVAHLPHINRVLATELLELILDFAVPINTTLRIQRPGWNLEGNLDDDEMCQCFDLPAGVAFVARSFGMYGRAMKRYLQCNNIDIESWPDLRWLRQSLKRVARHTPAVPPILLAPNLRRITLHVHNDYPTVLPPIMYDVQQLGRRGNRSNIPKTIPNRAAFEGRINPRGSYTDVLEYLDFLSICPNLTEVTWVVENYSRIGAVPSQALMTVESDHRVRRIVKTFHLRVGPESPTPAAPPSAQWISSWQTRLRNWLQR